MYDRATPIRNVIGVLAIAKLLDYRQTYDAYEALNDVARKDAELASFVKLKEFERAIVQMAQQHVAELQQRIARNTQALREIEQEQRSRSAIGVLCSVLGSLILLGTNLLAIQREPAAAPTD
jgi:4-diphosphocytidyl-2C-methyl-D-erythritol kinase